jgi:hypothetical protein
VSRREAPASLHVRSTSKSSHALVDFILSSLCFTSIRPLLAITHICVCDL